MNLRDPDHAKPAADDAALMLACKEGDEEAFVTLYHRYRDRLVNFCRRMLNDPAGGEEATQEVFLKVYAARHRYRADSRFSTYIYRVAKNYCINLRARHDRKLRATDSEEAVQRAATTDTPADAAYRARLREALGRALQKLPDNQAAAILLAHYQGCSYHEVANVLDVSESAVKSLVHRARERLALSLEPWMNEGSLPTR